MKSLWIVSLALLPAVATAGLNVVNRVPEPGMWMLIGGVVAALGISGFITRRSNGKGDEQ